MSTMQKKTSFFHPLLGPMSFRCIFPNPFIMSLRCNERWMATPPGSLRELIVIHFPAILSPPKSSDGYTVTDPIMGLRRKREPCTLYESRHRVH